LLVVESTWRHVAHHHGLKAANINARLHRRRDAQQINFVNELVVLVERDTLKQSLPAKTVLKISLAGQFLAMESLRRCRGRGQHLEIVPPEHSGGRRRRREQKEGSRATRCCADAAATVKVPTPADGAFPARRCRPCDV